MASCCKRGNELWDSIKFKIYWIVSHTSAHVVCFRPGNGFSSTRHRDLHPLRVSSVQFVLSCGRGVDRAESEISYLVALVCKYTLSPTSSRGTATRAETARLRKEPGNRGTPGINEVRSKVLQLRRRKQCGRTREGGKC